MKLNRILLLALLVISGCAQQGTSDKLTIVTTFYPLYDFTVQIGNDHVEVINLVGAGEEVHDFEPSPQDIVLIEQADAFVYNGAGFETWVDAVLNNLDNQQLMIIDTSANVPLLNSESSAGDDHEEDDHEEDEDHDHDHGVYDPHIWLNPVNALLQAEAIKDALVALDTANSTDYETNYTQLAADLSGLDQEFEQALSQVPLSHIVVEHKAFGYLAARYGLVQESILGLVSDSEPTALEMEHIIEFIQEYDVSVILAESDDPSRVLQTIAQEADVTIRTLYTLESLTQEQLDGNESYVSMMRKNLESLIAALSHE